MANGFYYGQRKQHYRNQRPGRRGRRKKIRSLASIQDDFKALWTALAASEVSEPFELGNVRFYDWRGVMEWGSAYYRSNYHPGHLPRPGGISAQTKQVKHDLRLFIRGIAWAQAKRAKGQATDDDERWLNEI